MGEEKIKLIATIVPLSHGHIMLFEKKDVPEHHQGWQVPNDLINHLEDPDDAAKRIFKDQTGIMDDILSLSHIESFAGTDETWHLVFHYRADVPEMVTPQSAVSIFAKWFPLNSLPSKETVAFQGWALDIIAETLGRAKR